VVRENENRQGGVKGKEEEAREEAPLEHELVHVGREMNRTSKEKYETSLREHNNESTRSEVQQLTQHKLQYERQIAERWQGMEGEKGRQHQTYRTQVDKIEDQIGKMTRALEDSAGILTLTVAASERARMSRERQGEKPRVSQNNVCDKVMPAPACATQRVGRVLTSQKSHRASKISTDVISTI